MDRSNGSVVHDLNPKKTKSPLIIVVIASILLGIGSGYVASSMTGGTTVTTVENGDGTQQVERGEIIGSDDTETYSDEAEGVLRRGGIEGEGAYHLERPGGESQYVYLTSTIIDLSQFEGEEVRVWGQTYAAEKAPWLMDVGRLELL